MITSTVEIVWDFLDPLFPAESGASEVVLAQFDCALNGRGYMIDWMDEALAGPTSIPMLATQYDTGNRPGSASISRQDLWRTYFTSFHHGSGQRWYDRSDSDALRFRQSKGVDVWSRDRVSLLYDTTRKVATDTATEMVAYQSASNVILHYMDNGTWKSAYFDTTDTLTGAYTGTITGLGASPVPNGPRLATDGINAYGIGSTTGVYQVTPGSLFGLLWATLPTEVLCIGAAHGRLVAAGGATGRQLYDITVFSAPVAIGGPLEDLGELYCGFAEGVSVIFAATNSAHIRQSKIYKITYDPQSATLGSPSQAGVIPAGETIQTIYGYLDFLFVGTDKGFRMCSAATDGTLTVGPLVPISGGVSSFSALSGSYVLFTWGNFDSGSAGVGRLDMTVFTDSSLVPAYASDVMANVGGTVPSVACVDNANTSYTARRPWFAVKGTGGGIYVQNPTDRVASGYLDTGLFNYGLTEQKDLVALEVRTEPLADGTIAIGLAANEGTSNSVDTLSTSGSTGTYLPTRHVTGDRHEVRFTLNRGTDVTKTPVVTGASASAWPAVQRGESMVIPILIYSATRDAMGYPIAMNLWEQITYIRNLAIPGATPVLLQLGTLSELVHISDFQTVAVKRADDGGMQATVRVQVKNLDRQEN